MRDKTEAQAPEESEQSLPFFARFLEGQDSTKGSHRSLKYPSDRDEDDQPFDHVSGSNNK